MTTLRLRVLGELADRILALRLDHPTRVGIDGHSAAGKTTMADELATTLRGKTARPVLRVTIDHFKRHVDLRTQYPPGWPESYYFEMFDVDAIRDELLAPLGPGGNRRHRTQIMDFSGRTPIDSGVHAAPDDAILVADGGFLQKPALSRHWDRVSLAGAGHLPWVEHRDDFGRAVSSFLAGDSRATCRQVHHEPPDPL
jgi:uridine kinase